MFSGVGTLQENVHIAVGLVLSITISNRAHWPFILVAHFVVSNNTIVRRLNMTNKLADVIKAINDCEGCLIPYPTAKKMLQVKDELQEVIDEQASQQPLNSDQV